MPHIGPIKSSKGSSDYGSCNCFQVWSGLSVTLGILIAFRTQQALDRFWEGRVQGNVVLAIGFREKCLEFEGVRLERV